MVNINFYLIDPTGPNLHLPVNPGEVMIRREKQFDTINIINIGEIDFPTGEKVKEISFSSFFPKEYDPSYCRYVNIPNPQEAMNQLTAWTVSKKPVRLIITDTIVNAMVTVATHYSMFRGGEPGDVYYDLVLRTWREIKVRTAAEAAAPVDTGGVANEPRPDTKLVPPVYEIKPGDSLWAIAKLNLGDGSKWQKIYDLNKDTIGPNPHAITTGTRLVMPS